MKLYWIWNRHAARVLWAFVIIGLIASLPLGLARVKTERSNKKVEFVMDYRDLLEISSYKNDPQGYVNDQLTAMQKAGIRSAAVYETTLNELQLARRLDIYTQKDISLLTGTTLPLNRASTYVLFTDEAARAKLQPNLEYWFKTYNIPTEAWEVKGRYGLVIGAAPDEVSLKPLGPDPMALEAMKAKGLLVVARISNRHQPYVEEQMDRILSEYSASNVHNLIVEGNYVPGYGEGTNNHIADFAALMDKHGLALAAVEMIRTPAGLGTLASKLNYNVLRTHSFTEADADKLSAALTPRLQKVRIRELSDRLVLAVKDRNIRMVFLNARPYRNVDTAAVADPLLSIYQSMQGPDGVMDRIHQAGYLTGEGPSGKFAFYDSVIRDTLKPFVALGCLAMIVLMLSAFMPGWSLLLFALGILGSAGLYVLSPGMLNKTLALGTGISSASVAMFMAIQRLRRLKTNTTLPAVGVVANLFIRATAVSLMGALLIVGLLNHVSFNLLLDQFIGVKALGILPVLIVGLYLLFFSEGLGTEEKFRKAKKLLASPITVLWIVSGALLVIVLTYYLSRTGNEGQVSGLEMRFRTILEDVLKVRPRTKEFLFGHPLFILGAYLTVRYRRFSALWIMLLGVIGQVGMVGTFTHLHTPVYISAIRVGYGLLFGAAFGFILIFVWNLFARGWRRWAEPFVD
ncbi:MAG: hypothetical protein H7X86_00080 [Gorillibacterium sp.]|nr:hypothetical protein [Gorillibacterium sp.]